MLLKFVTPANDIIFKDLEQHTEMKVGDGVVKFPLCGEDFNDLMAYLFGHGDISDVEGWFRGLLVKEGILKKK